MCIRDRCVTGTECVVCDRHRACCVWQALSVLYVTCTECVVCDRATKSCDWTAPWKAWRREMNWCRSSRGTHPTPFFCSPHRYSNHTGIVSFHHTGIDIPPHGHSIILPHRYSVILIYFHHTGIASFHDTGIASFHHTGIASEILSIVIIIIVCVTRTCRRQRLLLRWTQWPSKLSVSTQSPFFAFVFWMTVLFWLNLSVFFVGGRCRSDADCCWQSHHLYVLF